MLALATAALAAFVVRSGRLPVPAATTAAPATGAVERPDAIAQWLAEPGTEAGTDNAFATLFSLWKVNYVPGASQPACNQAEAAGLRCLYRQGSWSELADFDRPAIVTLMLADGRRYQAVVTGWDNADVTLRAGAAAKAFPLAALRRDWNGEFLLLWRPPPGSDGSLRPGMKGPGVVWLDPQLARLGGHAPQPASTTPAYDNTIAQAVRQFQRVHGLMVDGIAGEQTLIELNTALNRGGIPTLKPAGRT
jgi:general secretion pathway protein A